MTAASDPGLVSFTARVIEQHGGLVESRQAGLNALLPPDLAESLDLPEEAVVATDSAPLLYGSPLVDRVIHLATTRIPVLYARLEVPYLKKGGFERVVTEQCPLVGAQVSFTARAETRVSYLLLICHYVALSDERKEGLVRVAVNETTGAIIPNMHDHWREFQADFFHDGNLPPQFPQFPEMALNRAMLSAKELTRLELADFITAMRRRLHRDVTNTVEYFEALRAEMESALTRPNLTDTQRAERKAKMARLPEEMSAKQEDLTEKYSVKTKVNARAALRVLVPAVQIMAQIKYRRVKRSVSLIWNPVSKCLDPLCCDTCGAALHPAYPSTDGPNLLLLCKSCRDG